jgi:hypothetical protein
MELQAKIHDTGFIGYADQRASDFFVHADLRMKGRGKTSLVWALGQAVEFQFFTQGAAAQAQRFSGFGLVVAGMFQCGLQ